MSDSLFVVRGAPGLGNERYDRWHIYTLQRMRSKLCGDSAAVTGNLQRPRVKHHASGITVTGAV